MLVNDGIEEKYGTDLSQKKVKIQNLNKENLKITQKYTQWFLRQKLQIQPI